MAYVGNNLQIITSGSLALFGASESQGAIARYTTTDTLAAVLAANYMTDAQSRGLGLGDLVIINIGASCFLTSVIALQQPQPGPSVAPGQAALGVTLGSVAPAGSTGTGVQFTTAALQSAAIPPADVVGADLVLFTNTGVTPGNLQLPTAAQIVALLPNAQVGFAYELDVTNGSSAANTATLTTNTGLTLVGTMTVAQNATRRLLVSITALGATPAVTIQSITLP
jgi:hypothetical protein